MNVTLPRLLLAVLLPSVYVSAQTVNIQSSSSTRIVVENGRVSTTGDVIIGNGVTIQRTISCKSFHSIVSDQSMDIVWSYGEAPGVVIEGDENIVSSMSVFVSGGTLKIRGAKSYVSNNPLRAYVTSPSMRKALLTGSGNIAMIGCDSDEFVVDAQGSGNISVTGSARKLILRLSGSGDVDASGCLARSIRLDMKGAGDATVNCNAIVSGSMTGAGDLTVYGSPVVNVRNNGAGEIYAD